MALSEYSMFKVCLETSNRKEVRCFQLNKQQLSYLQLKTTLSSLLFNDLISVDGFDVYWQDEEGDMIAMKSNEEMNVALSQAVPGSFFKIYVKTKEYLPSSTTSLTGSASTGTVTTIAASSKPVVTTVISTVGTGGVVIDTPKSVTITPMTVPEAVTTIRSINPSADVTCRARGDSTTTSALRTAIDTALDTDMRNAVHTAISADDTSSGFATSSAGIGSATSTAGICSATSTAGIGSATSTAGPCSATSTAGPCSATSTAGPCSATSTAGPCSATSTAGPCSATSAGNIPENDICISPRTARKMNKKFAKCVMFKDEKDGNRLVDFSLLEGLGAFSNYAKDVAARNHKRKRHEPRVRPSSADATTASNASSTFNAPPVHRNIACDGCKRSITGYRYKCLVCYDYDLCIDCEIVGVHPQHPMIRVSEPIDERTLRSICKKFRGKCKHRGSGAEGYCTFDQSYATAFEDDSDTGDANSADVIGKLQDVFTEILTACVRLYSGLLNNAQKCNFPNQELSKCLDTLTTVISQLGACTNEQLQSRIEQLNATNVFNNVLTEIEHLASQFSNLSTSTTSGDTGNSDTRGDNDAGSAATTAGNSAGSGNKSAEVRNIEASLAETLNGLISQLASLNSVHNNSTGDQTSANNEVPSRSSELPPEINIPLEIGNICTTIAGVAHTAATHVLHNLARRYGPDSKNKTPVSTSTAGGHSDNVDTEHTNDVNMTAEQQQTNSEDDDDVSNNSVNMTTAEQPMDDEDDDDDDHDDIINDNISANEEQQQQNMNGDAGDDVAEKTDRVEDVNEDDVSNELFLLTKLYDMGFTDADGNLEEILLASGLDLSKAVNTLLTLQHID